jgi:ribose transport system permease protein
VVAIDGTRRVLGQRLRQTQLSSISRDLIPYAVLAALIAFMSTRQSGYVSTFQFNIVSGNALPLLLVAAGQTVVILAGGIDLSVGGVVSIVTAIAATRMHSSVESMAAVAALLVIGGFAAGAANGVLVTVLRIQPLIATLATWSIWGGLALVILPSPGGTVPNGWLNLTTGSFEGVSSQAWTLVLLIAAWTIFLRTKSATAIKALGSDRHAAALAGLSLRRTTITAYAISGLAAALAGLYLVSSTASGSPTIGSDYILPSIAAVGIGGARLTGGSARLSGTIAGAYILTIINDVAFSLGLPSGWSTFVVGPLLILAVLAGSIGRIRALLRRRS